MKVLYTDLDGTMVGPYGNFFAAEDRTPTLAPGRAGGGGAPGPGGGGGGGGGGRGRSVRVLPGALPAAYGEELPIDVMASLGLPDALFARWPGLEWHAPWHAGHEADAMLRGTVDVPAVDAWLADQGWDWLKIRDNGVLPGPDGRHIYHLMPDGLSKGGAVGWDLERRGLDPADAVAIGDSASDLGMAPYVGTMWVTANGAAAPHLPPLLAAARTAGQDVRVTREPVGVGWAEAVLASLG